MGTISLLDALSASKDKKLRVDTVIERELDGDDADVMRVAINDPHMPAKTLERALAKLGVTCSDTAITHWRDVHGVGKASNAG